MKTWIAIVTLFVLVGSCISTPIGRKQLSDEQITQLSHLMKTLESRKFEFEVKANNVKYSPNKLLVGKGKNKPFIYYIN